MSCIYDIEKKFEQKYESQEHIFPACIGGLRKLDKGLVCDHVNKNIFSKMELEFSRYSYISLMRPMIGPGKRGNLSEKKATSSELQIMELDEQKYILCKIKLGKAYYEKQIHIKGDKLIYTSYKNDPDQSNFINELPNLLSDYHKIFDSKLNNQIIISKFERKYYIVISNNFDQNIENIILKLKEHNFNKEKEMTESVHQNPIIHFRHSFNYKIYNRVLGKISFNCLANLMGEAFVKKTCFDNFRNWILGYSEDSFTRNEAANNINTDLYSKILPDHSHSVVFSVFEGYLICWICIYGNMIHVFNICYMDEKINLNEGFICD